MGLNVSFKGYIYDENDNQIDCNFQVHYVRQGVWNNVRSTDSAYYSCNAGDADSLTQDGDLKSGDVILLTFWQGDGSGGATPNNRDNLFDRFGVHALVHDGTTADYVIDIKLKPKQAPNISWILSTARTINRTITAYNYSDDRTYWTYNGVGFYHRQSYYGVEVFPKVNLLTTTYDWDDSNDNVAGYEATNNHSYTAIGDYVPAIRVVNAWGLQSDDTKNIRIKYNVPIGSISFSPDGVVNKVHTTEDDTYTAGIVDEDSRITSIDHKWVVKNRDDGSIISDTVVATNTTLDYTFTKTIQVLQKHYAEQVISWNDGYDDLTFTYSKELLITNWLPLVNFTYTFLNETKIKFTPNCSDLDGNIIEYKWDLYSLVPFQDGTFTLAKVDTLTSDADLVVDFNTSGHFKMVLVAKDDVGGTASHGKEFDVTGGGECVSAALIDNDVFFIFPEEYIND